jgi:chromate transporter
MILLQLFWEFFKTGLFAIGGGLATLPFLYEMQIKTGWFTLNDISNMIAISESTPGPMGVNMATYTGYTSAGLLGGAIAVAGLVAPSVIIIIIVSNILEKFKTNKIVQYGLYGLRAASAGLISVAGLKVAEAAFLHTQLYQETGSIASLFNIKAIIFGVILYVVYKKTGKHPILYIIGAGVVGVLLAL